MWVLYLNRRVVRAAAQPIMGMHAGSTEWWDNGLAKGSEGRVTDKDMVWLGWWGHHCGGQGRRRGDMAGKLLGAGVGERGCQLV